MTRLPDPTIRPGGLVDQFGRVARDLRVSVTDRCNLRCTYCMPADGLPWLPKNEMLTDEELLRIIGVFVRDGITQVRLTGGEPLLRRSLVELVSGIAALEPRPRIAMTTNGVGLERVAVGLAAAGLDRVNVSLDTIDAETFTILTRRNRLADVEAGLKAAADAGLTPVKVNAVAMRGVNDEAVSDVLAWCLERGYELRFIEQMPLDAQHAWDRNDMISAGSSSTAGRRPSASSPASARPSVRPATAPGSLPTGRCATASSRRPRPTCAAPCAMGRATTSCSACCAARCGARSPVTASTTPASCG